tara:strand:- start:899 stop:1369 length:471 start_codon:yes stop_codon:yes gene_type:complete
MSKKDKKIKSALEFLRYLSKPLDDTVIDKQLKDNNIIFERIDLYISFIRSLYCKIVETYLGDDVINSEDTKTGHFDWCWNNTIKDFREEGIDFSTNSDLYDWFKTYFMVSFYLEDKKELEGVILESFEDAFHFGGEKSQSDMDLLIELYEIFDKSF